MFKKENRALMIILIAFLSILLLILAIYLGYGYIRNRVPQKGSKPGTEFFIEDLSYSKQGIIKESEPYIRRSRLAKLNTEILEIFELSFHQEESIYLNLFEDAVFSLDITEIEETSTGGILVKGLIQEASYSEITLVYDDEFITGSVSYQDKRFSFKTIEGDIVEITEINQRGFLEEGQPLTP